MNPNDVPELCECGHEETDHDFVKGSEEMLCQVATCLCYDFKPRDAYWYADRAEDAAVARWEESVGR